MPSYFQFMFRPSERHIAYQPDTARDLQHVPPMHHRIRQTRISVMTADKVSEAFSHHPVFHPRGRNAGPRKRLVRNRLIGSIHAQRVMRTRPAKRISVRRIFRNVDAAASVYQTASSIHSEAQAEGIGVSMSRAAHPLRTGVDHHGLRVGMRIRKHIKTAVGKSERLRRSARSCTEMSVREFLYRLTSKQPDGFLRQSCRGKLPTVGHRTQRQRIGHLFGAVAPRIPQSPAIIVTKAFRRSCLCQCLEYIQHASQHRVIRRRNFHPVPGREQPRI